MLLELSTLIFFQVKLRMFTVHLPENISESWLWVSVVEHLATQYKAQYCKEELYFQ